MTKLPAKFDVKHDIDAARLAAILREEVTKTLNISAEAIAGGADGEDEIGISTVFVHDSLSSDKPAPKGGPPGVLTGTLSRSFKTRKASGKGKAIRVSAGTDVLYARVHEFGLGRMPKRPFMKKGIKSASPFIRRQFKSLASRIRARIQKEGGLMR
jgi:phage gpG-like protein